MAYAEDPLNDVDLDDPVWKYIPAFKQVKHLVVVDFNIGNFARKNAIVLKQPRKSARNDAARFIR